MVQPRRSRSWIRWLLAGVAFVFLLLAVLHGPILRAVVHAVAVKVAAGKNLRLEFRVEGGILGGVTLRDVHARATGPLALQSLDADLVRATYSLPDLALHGVSDFLKTVELRNVTAVLDSSKAPIPKPPKPSQPNEKVSLPDFFPDRLQATNVSLTIRGQPQDTVINDFNLGLYPNREGKLEIAKLQIAGVHTWTNIHATTTYANKNLYLRDLTLDEKNKLRTVNVDASQIGVGRVGLQLEGSLGGGEVASKIDLTAAGSSFATKSKVEAKNISLGELAQYLGRSPGAFSGDVKNAQIDWQGTLNHPASWNGTIKTEIENLRAGKLALDDVRFDISAADGKAMVRDARVDVGGNHVTLRGAIDLPKTIDGFGRTPGNFQIAIDASDLKKVTEFLPQPVTGTLQGSGNLKTANGAIDLDFTATGDLIGFGKAAAKKLTVTISATKTIPASREKNAPFFENLTSKVHAALSDLRYGDNALDQATADLKSDGASVVLSSFVGTRKNNSVRASGTFQVPLPNEKLLDQPADLQFELKAPQLADYWKAEAPNKVSGAVEADGSIRARGGVATGGMEFFGEQIAADKLIVRQIDLRATIAKNVVYLNDLTATLNAQDFVKARGSFDLRKPFHYTGAANVNLSDLSAFEPLFATAGKKTPLAGSLGVNWSGQGEAANFQNRGDLNLKLERGRYADLQNLKANVEAHYTPQELNVPNIFLGSDKGDFQASLQAKGDTLEISKIQIDQGAAKYATAYVALPFVWSNLGRDRRTFPPNGKVTISFQSQNFDIAKIFQELGEKPPVTGQLSVKLDAKGTLDQLAASLDLQMQNVQAEAASKLAPASLYLAARLTNNQLTVEGKIAQAKIQPIQITAQFPLNISRVIANRKVDEHTPLNAKVQMPRSSVNFIRDFVPALRQLDGTVALDVNLGGTIAHPVLSGTSDMSINSARFENATLPALTNFNARLNFRENTLRLERFGGDLAGGPFTLSGTITLPKLTTPIFDLQLKANSVLVARNDDLTARVDADVKIVGPLQSATASGQVLTTNSRFFKDIDIIPIGLPGRPAPQPAPSLGGPTLSFPNPPLRDWKFDVAIKSKEPFLIRGNLATGGAIIDMKLAGTGLHPQLQGAVRLENFDATLPFSTLTINLGFLYFDPDDPLNPRIELQGVSLIQDYTVHVYIYGTVNGPQAVFSSEPPLPQEDIISLLATGTTRQELTGGGNVIASRAALLLVKELYRRVFKKGKEPPKSDSIFNRLDVQFGDTDPRTGQQTATARYKISNHFVLVGDIGVQGEFRGLVKYLIRFR
ncbi:MAG TPA: translocation/assembly module TamB domain-containing protein [Chthoniobacterales bacterium]